MFKEGFLHNQGLVKDNKGKINPILPEDRPSRAELGIFRRDHWKTWTPCRPNGVEKWWVFMGESVASKTRKITSCPTVSAGTAG